MEKFPIQAHSRSLVGWIGKILTFSSLRSLGLLPLRVSGTSLGSCPSLAPPIPQLLPLFPNSSRPPSLIPQCGGSGQSLSVEGIGGVVGSGGSRHRHWGTGRGERALGIRVVAAAESQCVVGAAQRQGPWSAWCTRRGDVHVTSHGCCGGAGERGRTGVARQQFVCPWEGRMGPQVAQQLFRRGEALVARPIS